MIHFGCEKKIGKLTLTYFNVSQGQKGKKALYKIFSLMSDVTYYVYFLRKYICIDRCHRESQNINQPTNSSGANQKHYYKWEQTHLGK